MEQKLITSLLAIDSNVEALKAELNTILDINSASYEVVFVPFEYFIVDSKFKATEHEPEASFALDNNTDSKQYKMPANGFTITTILRGRKEQIKYYFDTLGQIGTKIIYIQPYAQGNTLKIFKEAINGGWHIRVSTLKDSDFRRIGRNLYS
jgi:hypothetical protein